ncbi:MAG TPA: hypothetical protein VNW95_09230 [Mucilaginibacter sp.]|jgi:hypothetical protein|nr:hypothetical protein [Mucilaginibacter sp.]
MEVHHHPQLEHKPKPWKEYLLEGLMIFLAVTMGFFAESIREGISDRSKEHEYVISMIEDARTDTANIHIAISQNLMRIAALDSLSDLLYGYKSNGGYDFKIYIYFRQGLVHPFFVSLTERTFTQLKNAGGMRLIHNKAAADSIIAYDDSDKKLANQQSYYERYLNESAEFGMTIFNFKYYKLSSRGKRLSSSDIANAKILTNDQAVLIKEGNLISTYAGVAAFYVDRLWEAEKHAVNLIHTLQKQYKLEDE